MPSDRVVRALLSKTMMAREDIDLLSEKQAWNLLYEASPPKAKDQRSQVCFTGFREPEKSVLINLAEANGLRSVNSVTKNLSYLVCGENAGPLKMEKAAKQGAFLVEANEFIALMETGEIAVD